MSPPNPLRLYANRIDQDQDNFVLIKYTKRLVKRYKVTGAIKAARLTLNHVRTILNVYGVDPACTLLFTSCEANLWPALKTLLVILGEMPARVTMLDGFEIDATGLVMDTVLHSLILEELKPEPPKGRPRS